MGPPDVVPASHLQRLFDLARGPGTPEELATEREVVAAMVAATGVAGVPAIDELARHRARRGSKVATRVAIASAVFLVGAGTAAAAGAFPDVAQSAIARAGSHVGLNLPNPHSSRSTSAPTTPTDTTPGDGSSSPSVVEPVGSDPATTSAASTSTTSAPTTVPSATPASTMDAPTLPASTTSVSTTTASTPGVPAIGPDGTGPAKDGLCRAWDAHRRNGATNDNSVAMRQLEDAAHAAGMTVEQYCADVLGPSSSAPDPTTDPVVHTSTSSPVTVPTPTAPGTTAPKEAKDNKDEGKGKGKGKDERNSPPAT